MMKVILKLNYEDDKTKQKVMKKVSGLPGVESIAFDSKEKKLTVTGFADPIAVVDKLKKICYTSIVSVGPAKEPEKKKEPEPKKADDKKKEVQWPNGYQPYYQYPAYYYQPQPPSYPAYYQRTVDEDPNSCVIS